MFSIRPAKEGDVEAIMEIYNQAVLRTTGTFDTKPKTIAEQKDWFARHNKNFPILVGIMKNEVVGWASLSEWSSRCAYAETAEISVYVHEKRRGMGYGKELLRTIIEMGRKSGLHTIIARIAKNNQVSLYLHRNVGFVYVGTMKEVGKKFGQLLDVVIMQLIY